MTEKGGHSENRHGRTLVRLWRLALIAWAILTLWPVASRTTRLLQILLMLFLWAGALCIWWRRNAIRWTIAGAALAIATVGLR